jgi:hypothetical protein
MPCNCCGAVTLMLTQSLPPLQHCCSQHQAATAALPPRCRRAAAALLPHCRRAAAVLPPRCCHAAAALLPCCRHAAAAKLLSLQPPPMRCCNAATAAAATTAGLPQPPSSCRPLAAAKLPMLLPLLLRYCNAATAAAATAAALPLTPPSCCHQAAAAKLPLPPHCRQAATTVTTDVTHAEIKHYTYVGIDNEYTLVRTVIGTIRNYKTNVIEKSNLYHFIHFFFHSKTEEFDTIFCYT